MKKHFTIKSVLIALLVMISCTMKAEIVEYTTDDGFAYSLDTETQEASLAQYRGEATEVVIPEFVTYEGKEYKVTGLGYECFEDCSSLTSIEIPSSVTSLGEGCFWGCSSLESIVVDANNPVYDSREGCNAIIETESNTMISACKSTRIPSSVTSLGDACFYGSFSLTSIEIPSSVTSLGDACFNSCSSLTSIEIPSSVTSLGYCCFYGCSSLKTVICKMGNVIKDSSLFERIPIEDATLYVPEGRLGTYKSTDPWSGFGTILPWTEELEVSVDETLELGIAIKTNNGNVMVSGLADGTPVSCYTLDGRMLGKASADGGTATFTAEPNSVVIVKVGKKSFKVYVK